MSTENNSAALVLVPHKQHRRRARKGQSPAQNDSVAAADDPVIACIRKELSRVTSIERLPKTLDQEFLTELWLQKRRAAIEAARYREMLNEAVRAIRAGAVVGPGLHEFRLIEITRKGGKKIIRPFIG